MSGSPRTETRYYDRFYKERFEVPPLVEELMVVGAFRRLWRVKQMAFGYLVVPRATHSRAEHSRGTWHMMTRVIERLSELGELEGVTKKDRLSIQIAALFHDVGHWPFSHSLEAVRGLLDHEENGTNILRRDPEIGEILHRYGLDPKRVAELIVPPAESYKRLEDVLLHSLLSADALGFDADRMEYLGRDAWLCGLPQKEWSDIETLLGSMRIHPDAYGMERGIVITPEGIKPLLDALLLRGTLRRISHARKVRAAEAMLVRATELVRGGTPNDSPLPDEVLSKLGDNDLLDVLATSDVAAARRLARQIKAGDLYPTILELGPERNLFHEVISLDRDKALGLAWRLASGWGVQEHEVLIDVPVALSKGSIDLRVLHPNGSLTLWREEVGWAEEGHDPRKVRVFVPPALAATRSSARVAADLQSALREL